MNHAIRLILLPLVFVMTACASTQIEEAWTLPGYTPPPKEQQKILVVALAARETVRKAFEDAFVAELETKGMLAVPSNRWIADGTTITRDVLRPIVGQNGITTVLIGSLRGIEKSETYQPPQQIGPGDNLYRNFDTYMVYSSSGQHVPGEYVELTEYLLETNLFNVKNEKLSWSVKTRTTKQPSLEQGIKSIVAAVIAQGTKDGVF